MDDRVALLEARVGELSELVGRLERRLGALEGRLSSAAEGAMPSEAAEVAPLPMGLAVPAPGEGFESLLPLSGRSFLVLGGAYLIRAITDAGTVARPIGVALGLAYAVAWVVFADRAGRARRPLSASFHGFLALVIGYPLLWEASTRLAVLTPSLAAATLLGLTVLLVGAAWRGDLRVLAWATSFAAVGTALALLVATHAIALFTALLLLLGGGSLWLTYGRRWHGLRWPTALGADAAVLVMAVLASWKGGPPEGYRDLSPGLAGALALALFILYPGSFAVRTLLRQRDVNVFEIVQTLAALVVGFGGAIRVAQAAGMGENVLGGAALVLAAACYGVAFSFVERQAAGARNFLFFTSLALVLALFSSGLVMGVRILALFWCALGVAASLVGSRFSRVSLKAHGAVYIACAALSSGLLVAALDSFLLDSREAWQPFTLVALTVLGGAAVSYASVAWGASADLGVAKRLPAFFLAVVTVWGVGGVAVVALCALAGASGLACDGAVLAALRTAVLAAGAVTLALVRSKTSLSELSWIAYPILVAGGIKLLLSDVPLGRAATLFPAFAVYGLALIWTPRLLRRSRKDKETVSPETPATPGAS